MNSIAVHFDNVIRFPIQNCADFAYLTKLGLFYVARKPLAVSQGDYHATLNWNSYNSSASQFLQLPYLIRGFFSPGMVDLRKEASSRGTLPISTAVTITFA